jgi:hypothetical protein
MCAPTVQPGRATCTSITPRARPIRSTPCLRNETLSLTTTLITKLLTNPLAQSRLTADSGYQSPASGPDNLTGRLSMAWKEPECRTWAQSGPNARDGASQNACLIGGGYFIHARFRPTYGSPPIWGSRGREFKSRQPDRCLPLSEALCPLRSGPCQPLTACCVCTVRAVRSRPRPRPADRRL